MTRARRGVTLPLHDVPILVNRSSSVANWVSQILGGTPGTSTRPVLLGLVQALLRLRSLGRMQSCDLPQLPGSFGGPTSGPVFYLVTDTPTLRDFQVCKKALSSNHQPVLVVPARTLDRATQLAKRGATSLKVPIFTIEGFLATGLILEALRRGCTVPEMWETIISEYNRSAIDGSQPTITFEWRGSATLGRRKA
jgi:hypothetical protein